MATGFELEANFLNKIYETFCAYFVDTISDYSDVICATKLRMY